MEDWAYYLATIVLEILGVLLVLISLLYVCTFIPSKDASLQQIESDGGRAVVLSCGRTVEYFIYGLPIEQVDATTPVLIIMHGYTLSGSANSSWHDICALRKVCVISPSLAGWGGSTPLRGRTYEDAAKDVCAILHHHQLINHPNFHIMGISFGSGNAAALAIYLMHLSAEKLISNPSLSYRYQQMDDDITIPNPNPNPNPHTPTRVKSLSLIVPAWPCMPGHDFWKESPFMVWLTGRPIMDRIWQYYIAPKLDIPKLLKSLVPKDWEEFERNNPKAVEGMTRELKRSTKYHLEGACDGMRLLREGGGAIYQQRDRLKRLLADRGAMSVWYAVNDTLAPPNGGKFICSQLVPGAKAFPQNGGHLNMFNDLAPFLDEALSNK